MLLFGTITDPETALSYYTSTVIMINHLTTNFSIWSSVPLSLQGVWLLPGQ